MSIIDLFGTLSTKPQFPETPVLPEDAREAFAILWALYETFRVYPVTVNDAFDKVMREAWEASQHNKKPGKKQPEYTLVKACDAFPELNTEWRAWFEGLEDRWYEEKMRIEARLTELAEQSQPLPGDEWVLAYTIDSGAYRSVDMGSGRYSKAAAEDRVRHYQHQGLEAELRIEHRERPSSLRFGKPFRWTDYEVWVKASKTDIRIADRRPGMTMVEWVASCWRDGVNPRVYQPFLPHGFEEAHGIGWDGTITPKEVSGNADPA